MHRKSIYSFIWVLVCTCRHRRHPARNPSFGTHPWCSQYEYDIRFMLNDYLFVFHLAHVINPPFGVRLSRCRPWSDLWENRVVWPDGKTGIEWRRGHRKQMRGPHPTSRELWMNRRRWSVCMCMWLLHEPQVEQCMQSWVSLSLSLLMAIFDSIRICKAKSADFQKDHRRDTRMRIGSNGDMCMTHSF